MLHICYAHVLYIYAVRCMHTPTYAVQCTPCAHITARCCAYSAAQRVYCAVLCMHSAQYDIACIYMYIRHTQHAYNVSVHIHAPYIRLQHIYKACAHCMHSMLWYTQHALYALYALYALMSECTYITYNAQHTTHRTYV